MWAPLSYLVNGDGWSVSLKAWEQGPPSPPACVCAARSPIRSPLRPLPCSPR